MVALRQDEHPPEKGPFLDSQVCHKHLGYPGAAKTITVTCHAAMTTTLARYVYVYLEGDDRTLTLCELEVYGHRGRPPIFQYAGQYCFQQYAVSSNPFFSSRLLWIFLWYLVILEYPCFFGRSYPLLLQCWCWGFMSAPGIHVNKTRWASLGQCRPRPPAALAPPPPPPPDI